MTLDQNLRPDASMDKLAKLKPLDTRSEQIPADARTPELAKMLHEAGRARGA